MSLLLIIEDDEPLRRALARELRRIPGAEVLEAGSVDEALLYVEHRVPDLVVLDLELPGRTGLEFVEELTSCNVDVPVFVVSGNLQRFAHRFPREALLRLFEKPLDPGELRDRVIECLRAVRDESATFTVADFLEIAAAGGRTVDIEARWRDGTTGCVTMVDGVPWQARYGSLNGWPAFGLVAWRPGARVRLRRPEGRPLDRTLEEGVDVLLLESSRLRDEFASRNGGTCDPWADERAWLRFLEERGALGGVRHVTTSRLPRVESVGDEPVPEEAFDDLLDAAVRASLTRDYETAARFFLLAERARPGDPTVRANLQRLREMGVRVALDASGVADGTRGER